MSGRTPARRRALARGASLLLAISVAGAVSCQSDELTQLILEIHTDYPVPAELDEMHISVSVGANTFFDNKYPLGGNVDAGQVSLPKRITLVPRDQGDPTFTIRVDGSSNDTVVVTRSATLGFVRGQSLVLRIDLLRECRNVFCPKPGDTCVKAGNCVPDVIDVSTLPVFDPSRDASPLPPYDGPTGTDGPGMDRADTGDTSGTDTRDGGSDGDAAPNDGGGDRSSDTMAGNNGAPCTTPSECDSGFCTDGVCCETACMGTCVACNVSGNLGVCSPVAAGTDPANECADEGTPSCGRDGFCDGAGACRRYPAGTICFPQSCSGFTRVLASRCDGLGTCSFGPTQSCSPYRCNAMGDCRTTCTDNAQCLSNMCTAGSCGLKPVGAACTAAGDCDSGFCEQGVCCASDCNGTCKSCAIMGSAGSCIDVPAGQDPLNQCADQGATTCGTSGNCDGKGSCQVYPAATSCASATCTGSMLTAAQMCDGKGTCASASAMACDPFGCNAGACRTSCATSADCAFGAFCVGTTCIPKKSMGADCTAPGECATGACVDGVCCDGPCAGACQACNVVGKFGTCSPVSAGTDPGNDCADEGTSSCGKDGACDGAGACRKYAQGTVCAAGSCTDSTRKLSSTCDGAGTCIAGTSLPCAPFVCGSGTDCLTTCSGNSQCVSPAQCMNGSCGRSPIGAACVQGTDCDSGFCAQGICCATSCAGTCRSCALSGSIGSCVAVPAGVDPLDQCSDAGASSCGTDGSCDGNGACRFYASNTVCGAATCNGTNLTPASTCNGAGTCNTPTVMPCAPYACMNGLCGTSCTGPAGCAPGQYCSGSTCVPQQPNGTSCAGAGECASGFCVDGVCCSDACTGLCAACNVAGNVGSCSAVPAGQDPGGDCTDQGPTSCGHDGSCDGAGACRRYASGTVCAPQSCGGSTRTLASRCDGAGMCVAGAQQPCDPFVCGSSGDCYTSCSTTAECLAPNLCVMGSCGKKPIGAACMAGTDCTSGFCAQGVCCSTMCTGNCMSCALSGSEGACLAVPDGQDPFNQCSDAGADSCSTDGACNGAGACRLYSAATQCAAPSCTGTTYTGPRTCNGTGTCSAAMTTSCAPYVCGATSCKTSCMTGADCAAGHYCAGTTCAPLKMTGQSCGASTECASTNCVDGVCCESTCTGGCNACSSGKTGQPDGLCRPVTAGTDPDGDCNQEAAATCGLDGQCDGAGACRKWASGTTCVIESCSGSTYTPARSCNGTGTCGTVTSTSCAPYVCGATSCKTSCGSSADCTSGNFCSGGACVPQKANGAPCGGGSECSSGACVDGVCCESACTALCQACSMGKTGQANGLCRAVTGGTDPDSDCAQQAAATCGTDGMCDGGGACRLWAASTVCVAESCSGTTYTPARTCNGTGTCQSVSTSSCVPYTCGASACKTTCASSADCSSGNYCSNSACVAQKANGAACAVGGECTSGSCVDSVCCESACGSVCQACSMGKTGQANGLCRNVTNGTDPDNECATSAQSTCSTDGFCNGSGACRLWDATTQCAAATCSGSTYTPARTCNGMGTCQSVSTVPCDPYACNPTACKTSCASSSDCATGYTCNASVCGTTLPLGSACTTSSQCSSNNCVDNVCCESACTGLCLACSMGKTGQPNGLCRSISNGTDPDNECTQNTQMSCANDGFCNGSGACRLWVNGTVCVGESCSGSTYTPNRTCNGMGTCQTVMSVSCAPYTCGTSQCKTTCTVNADCTAGNYCAGGSCVPTQSNGAACSAGGQCTSGACVDGVCCESTCTGLCVACSMAKTGQPNGLCRGVSAGADPDNECAMDPPSSCQKDGTCNGSGACRLYGSGTICVPESCNVSTYQPAGFCAGGFCGTSPTVACDPYNCGPTTCKTSCASSADCTSANYCNPVGGGADGGAGSGTCVPKKPQGAACGGAGECNSGFCVDGFCCNGACNTACRSCGLPGNLGVCSNVVNAEDPPSCSGTNICNASAVCTLKNGQPCTMASACASNFCVDSVCCNSACNNTCVTCTGGGQTGTCHLVPAGQTDPPTCVSPNTCSGAGTCGSPTPGVPVGLRPLNGANTGSVFYSPSLRPTFTWSTAQFATSYEIQIDDSCTSPTFCNFPSPVIYTSVTGTSFQPTASLPASNNAPVGTRYYWRVRGCNSGGVCGGWSSIRYVNVGRLRDDLNGDGYSDVVVGAPQKQLNAPTQGRVYVFLGRNPMDTFVDYTIDGPKAPYQFGSKVTFVGDLNGDGFADLAVGAATDTGSVFVFYGPSLPPDANGANVILNGEIAGDQFGARAISPAGDINGDGFADMVVGAPLNSEFFNPEQGKAYVFNGSPAMDALPDAEISGTISNANFGSAVAGGGDQNGDGIPDLVVGSSGYNGFNGRAYVFYGPSFPNDAQQGLIIDTPQQYGMFGREVASDGDIDGDRVDDVLIGAPQGALAYVLLGRFGGMDPSPDLTLTPMGFNGSEFGAAVCLADVTSDGLSDYFVADDRADGVGAVSGYFGPNLSGFVDWPVAGRSGNVLFGYSVAGSDFNGNGIGDIIIGDPAYNQQGQAGRVYLYLGGSPPNTQIDYTLTGESDGDFFGASVY